MLTAREPKTIVIFRDGGKGDIFALFPSLPGAPGGCSCYQHVGQHSSADYTGCIATSRPATHKQYAPLARELRELGYRLDIRARRPHNIGRTW